MIVVGGESLVDLIGREADRATLRAVPGGGPYNVARTAARLGRDCAYLGALSRDRFGLQLRAGLRDDGVDDRYAPTSDLPTTLAVAQVGADGAATYGFYVEGTSACDLAAEQALAVLAARPRILYVGTLGLVLEPAADSYAAVVAAADADVLVAVDPNCRPGVVRDADRYRQRLDAVLARSDLVKVSTDDLELLHPDLDHRRAASAVRARSGGVVLVTAGGGHVTVVSDRGETVVPVPVVPVVDTVGAGDSFLGAVLAAWDCQGLGRDDLHDAGRLRSAVRFGIDVAGITCGRVGADPPRATELPAAVAAALAGS